MEQIGDLIEKGVNRIKQSRDLDGWKDLIMDGEFTEQGHIIKIDEVRIARPSAACQHGRSCVR